MAEPRLPVTLVAAVAENGVIGSGNAIPWRLPSDFAQFKQATMGKPLIMGRKTFESIGRPLPGRTTIVVSRSATFRPEGAEVVDSLEAALERADQVARDSGATEIIVAGGGDIYQQAMPLADRLRITHVALSPEGDATFPAVDPSVWVSTEEIEVPRSPADTADYSVKLYLRR